MTATPPKQKIVNWRRLFIFTLFSAYFYAIMEWLFFATKSSSLTVLSLFDKIKVFFITGGILALILLASLAVLSLPALLMKDQKWRSRLILLAILVPAFTLSLAALLMFDNFSYTVFKWGIVTSKGLWRIPYAIGFVTFMCWMMIIIRKNIHRRKRPASLPALGLLAISIITILTVTFSSEVNLGSAFNAPLKPSADRPNIIILGSDGLSANYLSMFGYKNETTPFLKEMADKFLIAENAFPNVSSTTASTTSAMTGKEPTAVKVFRYPDILSGNDSFEHLPGILKHQGYETVEIGTPYYVDAEKLNLLDGFDIVNDEALDQPMLLSLRAILGNSPSTYFIMTIISRASERLLHIFFIKDMLNPLEVVNNPKARMTDGQRVDEILKLIDNAEQPVYIFTHLMDTHGPHFSSEKQVFSNGATDEEWDIDRYKDAILTFDGHVKKIYDHLAQTGQLDNTILVIYTDHGYKYSIFSRIPILMHFPNNEYAGSRKNNIQIIDIPATVLDYLDLPKPKWMTGTSFLTDETPIDRQIIGITASSPKKIGPPFYQIKIVQVIVCQKWYELNVQDNTFETGAVSGHTSKCDEKQLPADDEIHQKILDYLEKNGYDISSLK